MTSIAPPYPSDTRAKGWRFELDYEQVEQSTTWGRTKPEARPWLLMLWMVAWKQTPCGSFPDDHEAIAGLIGAPETLWKKHGPSLLRGWWRADDGRLYHDTLSSRVFEMMGKRRSDSDRQAARRAREASDSAVSHAGVARDTPVTPTEVRPESSTDHRPPITEKKKEHLADSSLRTEPPPPPSFDGKNAEVLNGKSVVSLSDRWELPESWGVDAEALGWQPREVLLEAEKFRQYWTAGKGTGTRRAVKGWRQSWSNWLGKAAERKIR